MNTREDIDETARIILMDQEGLPRSTMRFIKALRNEHREVSLSEALAIWQQYMGMDGLTPATHDYRTGHRL